MRVPVVNDILQELCLDLLLFVWRLNVVAIMCAHDLHVVHTEGAFGPGRVILGAVF